MNNRRLLLIKKKFREGLSRSEEEELKDLQIEWGRILNLIHPLPFDKLKELEEYVDNGCQKTHY